MNLKLLVVLVAFSVISCAQKENQGKIGSFNYENLGKPVFGLPIRQFFWKIFVSDRGQRCILKKMGMLPRAV